jgi:hypothetical protein
MAYAERTEVPFDRSVQQIIAMLRKSGADQIGQIEAREIFAVQFTMAERMIRMTIGLADGSSRRSADQIRRQRARALLLVIKAKLESIASGIETVEQAFLANVVMADGATVYERVRGDLAIEYRSGQPSMFLLAGASE